MYNNVNFQNGCYGYDIFNKYGKCIGFKEAGKEVVLDEICESIENGEVIWKVSFNYLGRTKRFEFERKNIAKKDFVALLNAQGADVTSRTFNCFIDSMRLQEDQITCATDTYNRTGWIKLPVNGKFEYHYRCGELLGTRDAEYTGNHVLKPKGSLTEWIEMVKKEVVGRVPMETILLAALSAPIVGIHGINATTDNPIYHINGRSSTGKSTASCLAASVSGDPFEGMRTDYDSYGVLKDYTSIYGSWGTTPKATISTHAGNRGTVVILNELGKFTGNDMTPVVFNLSEGSDIKRLNTSLETLVSEGFNTVFISNGEMSLINRCKTKLEGIKNRVMELTDPLTDSAEHSRRIKDCCVKNNGFAAPMIAQYIIDNGGYQMIQELYQETLVSLSAAKPEKINERFVEKFPVFLVMASKLAEQALGIKFSTDAVVAYCYECVKRFTEKDGEVDASYNDIIGECSTHIKNFYNTRDRMTVPMQVWGAVSYPNRTEGNKVVTVEYGLKRNILKELLDKHGHPNMDTCIAIWKKAGVLNYEEGRNTRNRKIGINKGDEEDLYVLKVLVDAPKGASVSSKTNLAYLLSNSDDDEEVA